MTVMGIPIVPARTSVDVGRGMTFTAGHHFTVDPAVDVDQLAEEVTAPLSVIVQVTKRCDFDCSFCSETLQLPDPALTQLETMRDNLAGVPRIFLSGGEPLMRKDFGDIVAMYHDAGHLLGIPTNATHGLRHAKNMVGKVAYVNVGTAVATAWTDRRTVERGTARLIETSIDVEHGAPPLPEVCQYHGLSITRGVGGLLSPAEIQAAYEQVFVTPETALDQGERDRTAQALGLSALYQSLLTALLSGEETDRCTWQHPFPVDQVLANVAWDAFPHVLPDPSLADASAG